MKQVKTAKGRVIDMAALSKTNEQERAVSPGNVNMNARGDRLDSSGNVIQTVQAKSRAAHDTAQKPEKTKLSEAPGTDRKKKAQAAVEADKALSDIVRQETKTRDDGTQYIETEYNDGSIETKDLDNG